MGNRSPLFDQSDYSIHKSRALIICESDMRKLVKMYHKPSIVSYAI